MIRYPGSKVKLYRKINAVMPDSVKSALWSQDLRLYCEPFIGSGAVCWKVLSSLSQEPSSRPSIIVGDIDLYMIRLWQSVRDVPQDLVKMVMSRTPRAEDFAIYKRSDGDASVEPTESAYRKLVLHNTSWSGAGCRAGSVLGGKNPRIDCNHLSRWNPQRIRNDIYRVHGIMRAYRHVQIECADFAQILCSVPIHGFAYLDPPYYLQGKNLYKHNMTEADHVRLSDCLRTARYRFLLSYDDEPRIRDLYLWANIIRFEMTPSIATVRRTGRCPTYELLITNVEK